MSVGRDTARDADAELAELAGLEAALSTCVEQKLWRMERAG